MKNWTLHLLMVIFLNFPLTPESAQAGSAPAKVVLTFGSFSEREGALFVALDQGFFRKYDLDVRLVHVRSGPVGLAALSAGESQFYNG